MGAWEHTHTRKHIHCPPHVERLCVRCVNILWALWRLLLLCPTQAKHPDWQPSQNVISSGFYIAKWKLCELLLSNVRQHFRAPHFNYRRRQLSLGNAIRLHAMWPLSNGNLLSVLYTIDITNPHYKHRERKWERDTTTRAAIHLVRYSLLFAGTQGVCAILICTLNYWAHLCNTFRPRLHLILMKHYVTIY